MGSSRSHSASPSLPPPPPLRLRSRAAIMGLGQNKQCCRARIYLRRLGNSGSLYVSSRLRRGPGTPIAPLCNTQENLPPAQVQASEKQTPSVTCLLYTRLLGLPSPLLLLLQSIRPLFSLFSLCTPQPNHLRPPFPWFIALRAAENQ